MDSQPDCDSKEQCGDALADGLLHPLGDSIVECDALADPLGDSIGILHTESDAECHRLVHAVVHAKPDPLDVRDAVVYPEFHSVTDGLSDPEFYPVVQRDPVAYPVLYRVLHHDRVEHSVLYRVGDALSDAQCVLHAVGLVHP